MVEVNKWCGVQVVDHSKDHGAVMDNDSAIIMISLAVLLISAKGVGWRPQPIYRDSNKNSAPGFRDRRAQSAKPVHLKE